MYSQLRNYDIKQANYYINESINDGNVTDLIKLLFKKYEQNPLDNNILVCNETFTDTIINSKKQLFITIQNTTTFKQYKYTFDEGETIYLNNIFNELNNASIEASIGEIMDKYSILELKTKYIFDEIKLKEIKKEMDMLYKNIDLSQFSYFYKLLLYINEQIWIDTDIIKSITLNADNVSLFAETSNNIFINNQKRFRLKTYFNVLHNSNINEQKGYKNNICFIDIDNENDIYNKIPEINYLLISYDIIYFSIKYKTIINALFINPNIEFVYSTIEPSIQIVESSTFCIDPLLSSIYDFEHISYLSGGKLGDFINQLSVISETFYDTGKKGILYIDNIGDTFTFGLENTYNDTYNSITSQKFIKDYKMYNNEIININLSSWRTNFITTNWHNIFKNKYNVSWGKHTWLSGTIDTKWNNKTIINVTPYRFLLQNTIHKLTEIVNADISNCIFISNEDAHYKYFCENTGINIEHYQPNSFDEIVTIVNSCKMAYLGLSSMATIANALHKKHILLSGGSDTALNNLTGIMQHMIDII